MDKFLIIDGNSIMNRAFYGLGNTKMFSKTANIHTNAIYGFLNIYWMIIDKLKPEYVSVSFDLKAPTFRHLMYADYKGTRKGMPDELREQMPVIKQIMTAMNVPILELEGYEADDILGTVANENTKKGIFTYILTGDKDSFQLISSTTSIVMPSSKPGKTEYTIYTPELLKEKFNIEPYQVIHIKSLMGDASDNIPGVKGIGEKTAYSLIEKYTTLENIYDNIETIDASEKIREKLISDKETAYLSQKLATINIEVPVTLNYKNLLLSDVNKEQLYILFKKLEFTKFLTKYDFAGIESNVDENVVQSNESKEQFEYNTENVRVINNTNISECIELFDKLNLDDKVSYMLNLNNKFYFTNNVNMSQNFLAVYIAKEDYTYIFDFDKLNSDYINEILLKFSTIKFKKLGYNVKQDMLYIFNNVSGKLYRFEFDVMIAYYLLDSNKSNYKVGYILNDLFNIELENIEESQKYVQISLFGDNNSNSVENKEVFSKTDIANILKYLKGVYLSNDLVISKLKDEGMLYLFNNIEMPLAETLAFMEHSGMYIDKDKLNSFDIEITESIKNLEKEIYDIADFEFNINSPKQLGEVLFERLGLPTVRKNKTGYSTDKEVLDKLSEYHPIIDKILEYRQVMKLKTTYVDGLRDKIAQDGRIHTTFMQTVASTGRLSSVEPNLQNIPIRLELGRKIRSFFVGEAENIIVDADYSQIELRVLAHISNDSTMIDAFNNDIDIHKVTASQVFGVPLEEVTSSMRSKAKAVNFGIVYGISEFGLAKNISVTRKEASEYIQNYLDKYHGIREFMVNIVKEAKENGFVSTMFGRKRYIPELKQKNKNIIQFGERIAMNTPIQGSAADIIKLAMNKIYRLMKDKNLKSRLVMQVHDELIIEAVPEELDVIKEIMYDAMENVCKLNVHLDIDLNIGKNWYEAK
jgi:DNA polymerase-1